MGEVTPTLERGDPTPHHSCGRADPDSRSVEELAPPTPMTDNCSGSERSVQLSLRSWVGPPQHLPHRGSASVHERTYLVKQHQ